MNSDMEEQNNEDRPNTAPIGRDRKNMTSKANLLLRSTYFKDLPFLCESRERSLQISPNRG